MNADIPRSKGSMVSLGKPDHVRAMAKLNQLKLQSCKSSSDIPHQQQPVSSNYKRDKATSQSRKPYPNATLNSHRDQKESSKQLVLKKNFVNSLNSSSVKKGQHESREERSTSFISIATSNYGHQQMPAHQPPLSSKNARTN